jgi:UDP-N-acetylmuramoyl-tripeptide--D-alanyl-D-alanine ligase
MNAKLLLQKLLERQVKRYFKRHQNTRLVVVTGSVGKTSTKVAIAQVLSEKYSVRSHSGNHNTHMSVPPAMLGVKYPENIRSLSAWLKVLREMGRRVRQSEDVDVIVQELGTDQPGDIPYFGNYLKPDIAVVTAVSPEHMEFFKTVEAVAAEELSVASYSKLTIVNRDDVSEDFAKYAETSSIDTYGLGGVAEYRYSIESFEPGEGFKGKVMTPEIGEFDVSLALIGEHNVKAAVAAAAVGVKLGLTAPQITKGLSTLQPVPGRMQLLRGMNESTILDDTYNSSPLAVQAALQTLYNFPSPSRIAILGSMNELGETSPSAHQEIGKMCDPTLLSWVVTIGDEAEKYIATAAKARGCQVQSFKSPYEAGAFVHRVLEPGAVVLAKGSQNGVFAEEAIKIILHTTDDEEKLVRQNPAWMAIKQEQFPGYTSSH